MIEKSNNIKHVLRKETRLLWFIENFILASKKPVDLGHYEDEIACFPVDLLGKEKTGLFPLGEYSDEVGFKDENEEYGFHCSQMLKKIEREIYILKNEGLFSGEDKFEWQEDPGYWGYGYAIFMNCSNIPILEAYLKYLRKKTANKNNDDNSIIQKIEILEDKNETGRIKVYINGKYDSDPLDFARGKNWQLMYKIANKEYVAYNNKSKEFYDYFNHIKKNPLYAKHKFKVTTILKREDSEIKPNIEIKLITKNKTTRQLKSA